MAQDHAARRVPRWLRLSLDRLGHEWRWTATRLPSLHGYTPSTHRFDPDRFAPAGTANRPRYAYIPFGAGPRFCVGNTLGMMEAVLVTAMIARELRLSGAPGRAVRPEPMLSLRVRGGLRMTVHPAAA